MGKKSWVRILLFLPILFQVIDNQAQTIQKKFSIRWNEPYLNSFSDGSQQEFLTFENASYGYDAAGLPVFYEIIPVDKFYTRYDVRVVSQEFEDMTAAESRLIPQSFHQQSVNYQVHSARDRNRIFAQLQFIPIVDASFSH